MKWPIDIPPLADGLWYGSRIHQFVPMPEWPAALETVPVEHRPRAEAYLREEARKVRMHREWQRGRSDAA